MKIAEKAKTQFCGHLPSFAVEHWDGKLLPDKGIMNVCLLWSPVQT